MTLTGAALGCSGGGARPIVELVQGADTGGSETGGPSGEENPTGGREESAGNAGEGGAQLATGGVSATGGMTETGGNAETGGSESGGTGGTGGTGGGGELKECSLWDHTNALGSVSNTDCGIQGVWYAYDDCLDSPNDCTVVELPRKGTSGFENEGGRMCTRGTTATPTKDELGVKWGAGIGLSLNETDERGKRPIGELAGVELVGFTFIVSGANERPGLVVTFPVDEKSKEPHLITLDPAGSLYTVMMQDAQQDESYVKDPVPLEVGAVQAIQFQIRTTPNTALYFDFCIEQLTALYRERE